MPADHELEIAITKGKGTITVNTDSLEEGGDLTPEVYREAMIQGLKVILNRGMSKITKESFTDNAGNFDEDAMKAEAMKIATKTFQDMRENAIRFTGGKQKKVTGEVMTEAMRVARAYVKQFIKDQGQKVSHVDNKEITKAAKLLLADNPELVEEAKATVEARKAAKEKGIKGKAINVEGLVAAIPVNEAKKAKLEAEAKERKAASSAKKAGKTVAHPATLKTKPQVGGLNLQH